MLDNGVKDINTVKVYHTILAALIWKNMMESLNLEKNKGRELHSAQMDQSLIKVNGIKDINMDLELSFMMTVRNMKVNGCKEFNMEMEVHSMQQVRYNIKENGKTDHNKAKEFIFIKMETSHLMEVGNKANNTVTELLIRVKK